MDKRQWKNKLDISDLHKQFQNEEISVEQLGKKVSERIKNASFFKKYPELEEIAENFANIDDDIDEYDNALSYLYDWGDMDKQCWINTF